MIKLIRAAIAAILLTLGAVPALAQTISNPPGAAGGGGGCTTTCTYTDTGIFTLGTANKSMLTTTGYSVTGSNTTPLFNMSAGTWNTTGAPTLLNFVITDTASNSGSTFLNFNLNGGDKLTIGKSGSITTAGSLTVAAGSQIAFNGRAQIGSCAQGTFCLDNSPAQTFTSSLTIRASNELTLGEGNSATPTAQTLGTQGSRSGTDTNVKGADLTINSGPSTGNATPSVLNLQSPVPTTSGSGAQTMTRGAQIFWGTLKLTSYTVSGLPACSSVGAGAMAWVTDATSPTYNGTLTGGGAVGVPVGCDGTAWHSV